MKPVFKCEYCTFMGTEEEVKAHEDTCFENYDKKSLYSLNNLVFKTHAPMLTINKTGLEQTFPGKIIKP